MVVLEPLNKLLQQKWETFASKRFYFSFVSYLSFMIIFTAIAYYQPLRVKVGPVFFYLERPEWMELSLKSVGWLSSLPLPFFSGFCFYLAAFISSGVHSWRLPVGLWTDHYLARRHLSTLCSGMGISSGFIVRKKKRKRSLTWRQQIQFSWYEGVHEWMAWGNPAPRHLQCQHDLAVTGVAQARLLGKRKNRFTAANNYERLLWFMVPKCILGI